jgi:hypothetical protein
MNILDNFTIDRLGDIISDDISSGTSVEEIKSLAKFALEAKLYGWVTNDSEEVIELWNETLNK